MCQKKYKNMFIYKKDENIPIIEIVQKAVEIGKSDLALLLLKYEKLAVKKVPILLHLEEYVEAI